MDHPLDRDARLEAARESAQHAIALAGAAGYLERAAAYEIAMAV